MLVLLAQLSIDANLSLLYKDVERMCMRIGNWGLGIGECGHKDGMTVDSVRQSVLSMVLTLFGGCYKYKWSFGIRMYWISLGFDFGVSYVLGKPTYILHTIHTHTFLKGIICALWYSVRLRVALKWYS